MGSEYWYSKKNDSDIFFFFTEVASRLSHKCTEQLVIDNALSVIFKVVRDSNRSLAHMGLIKLALDIFINVSKVQQHLFLTVYLEALWFLDAFSIFEWLFYFLVCNYGSCCGHKGSELSGYVSWAGVYLPRKTWNIFKSDEASYDTVRE